MRRYENQDELDTTMGQTGFACIKPEGLLVDYDGVGLGDGEPSSSYYVEMCIDPGEHFAPDISPIKQAIDTHLSLAHLTEDGYDEYTYDLIKKIVGEYITEDMT